MSPEDLRDLAIGCGTAAALFMSLSLAAAAMAYQTVQAGALETRRVAFSVSERIATMLSSLTGDGLQLLPDEFLEAAGELAHVFASVSFDVRTFDSRRLRASTDAALIPFSDGERVLREIRADLNQAAKEAITGSPEQIGKLEKINEYRELDAKYLISVRVAVDSAGFSIDQYEAQHALWVTIARALKKSAATGALSAISFVVAGAASTSVVTLTTSEYANLVIGWSLIVSTAFAFGYAAWWVLSASRNHLQPGRPLPPS